MGSRGWLSGDNVPCVFTLPFFRRFLLFRVPQNCNRGDEIKWVGTSFVNVRLGSASTSEKPSQKESI